MLEAPKEAINPIIHKEIGDSRLYFEFRLVHTEPLKNMDSNQTNSIEPSSNQSFSDFISDPELLSALNSQGLTVATKVQAAAIPPAIKGHDLIVQAQTGSGKTLAFVVPLISRVRAATNRKGTIGLIVAPTRELATQVRKVVASIAPDIKPACLIGGASSRDQIEELGDDRRIIVGTPGRILDFIRRREILLRTCTYFVLDEADEMLSMGFLEDVRSILSRLPDKRQGLFVSATITPRVQVLAQSFLTKPKQIVIESTTESAPEIEHLYCEVQGDTAAKAIALCDLIETQRPRAAIIFCNTKSDTELVEVYLRRRGFDARRINSDLSHKQRERIMAKVHDGSLRLLVATDVAARGIDIEQLDLIFNYAIHEEPETYVHRTGRTGRAGRRGKAISLVGPQDFGPFYNLRKRLSIDLKKIDLPTQEEVAQACLAHFYELMRDSKSTLSDKEINIARSMLKDLGDLQEPGEELSTMIAKLYSLVMKTFVNQQSKSLDEETLESEPSHEPSRDHGRRHGRDSDRHHHSRGRGHRDSRR